MKLIITFSLAILLAAAVGCAPQMNSQKKTSGSLLAGVMPPASGVVSGAPATLPGFTNCSASFVEHYDYLSVFFFNVDTQSACSDLVGELIGFHEENFGVVCYAPSVEKWGAMGTEARTIYVNELFPWLINRLMYDVCDALP